MVAVDDAMTSRSHATGLWRRTTGARRRRRRDRHRHHRRPPGLPESRWNSTSRVIASAVIDPNASTAADTYGHGTAVAGLIAGNSHYRGDGDPLQDQYAGSAPNANLISIKVANDDGQATTLDALYGLQFAVDHKDDYNIRVINMSFRSTDAESYTTDPLDAAAEQAWFDGITVVAAAGNMGTASDAVSYAPGNDPYVITVGAVDDQGTADNSDDVVASWSSQGTTQDGFAKPDVVAPGAHIVSTLAPNSDFASLCPTCVINGSYFQVSGTSLAAPIVAGVAADLIAAHPDWTPAMVKGALVNTATQLPGGANEVNATAANWAGNEPAQLRPGPHAQHADRPRQRQHQLQRRQLERRQLEHRQPTRWRPAGVPRAGAVRAAPRAPALATAAATGATAGWTRPRPAGAPSAGRRSGVSHERDHHHQDHLPYAFQAPSPRTRDKDVAR